MTDETMLHDWHILKALDELGLTQLDAATLLSVNIRTVRRWVKNPNEITGPAKQALIAWQKLHRLRITWWPDGIDTIVKDYDEFSKKIAIYSKRIYEGRTND